LPSPFTDSLAHLLAELERLDLCVRAQVVALRRIPRADANLRGLYLTDDDVDELLQRPPGQPRWPVAGAARAALDNGRRELDERAQLSLARGVELRLPRLQRHFDLSPAEVDVLLLAMAAELDLRYEALFGYLQDDVTRKRLGVGLLLDLLAPELAQRLELRRRIEPQAPLRAHRLLALVDDAPQAAPLLACSVKVEDRVVRFLLGNDEPDESLGVVIRRGGRNIADLALDPSTAHALGGVADAARAGQPQLVQLIGAPGSGKRDAAEAVARRLGRPLLQVDLARPPTGESFDSWCAKLERETRLQSAPLYCTGFDELEAAVQQRALYTWAARLGTYQGLIFVAGRRAVEPAGDARELPFVRIEMPVLDATQRAVLWREELGALVDGDEGTAAALAGKFRFGPVQIRDAAATMRRMASRPGEPPRLSLQDAHEACRLHSNQKLSNVARKITPKYRWADIVLPADRLAMLRDICNHMKYRGQVYGDWGFGRKLAMGKGLAVLFAGPSGTGKTMAADIIAGELGLDLFKIDLASIISKYIGETEKNLGSIFDEAETSNAILFFDEADALFGKRSEVKDSHDRYANVEVGYLLQRLEEYEGVAILATNFRKNMDEAFVRRLHFTVEFPFPTHEDRRNIWARAWPEETPRDDAIDPDDLGRRFEMTGGNISNVVLAAAFLAADEGGRVQLGHVMRATQREFQKMGKLTDDRAFAITSA
jgi:AAA+ superfamily predicted ATPase